MGLLLRRPLLQAWERFVRIGAKSLFPKLLRRGYSSATPEVVI